MKNFTNKTEGVEKPGLYKDELLYLSLPNQVIDFRSFLTTSALPGHLEIFC